MCVCLLQQDLVQSCVRGEGGILSYYSEHSKSVDCSWRGPLRDLFSLVRDGQTSPHRPWLVVSRSTCPPISPPHATSFVLGHAVINTHTAERHRHYRVSARWANALLLAPAISQPFARYVRWRGGHEFARAGARGELLGGRE